MTKQQIHDLRSSFGTVAMMAELLIFAVPKTPKNQVFIDGMLRSLASAQAVIDGIESPKFFIEESPLESYRAELSDS